MKLKKTLSFMLALVLILANLHMPVISADAELTAWDGSVSDGFAEGTGTAEDPYLISNGAELAYFASQVNGGNYFVNEYETPDEYVTEPQYVALAGDIDLGGVDFTPIGDPEDYNTASFGGCFDGCGFSIVNFYTTGHGLFGKTYGSSDDPASDEGRIENLSVYGDIVSDAPVADVGGIVSRAQGGVIKNCSFTGSVTVTNASFCYFGGVVGEMENGFIFECTSRTELSVDGEYRGVGGVIGGAEYNPPLIEGCMNYGDIVADANNHIGGIVGKGNTVLNSGNRGNITVPEKAGEYSTVYAGGIAGYSNIISNCCNTGNITVNFDMDGGCIAGIAEYGQINNCYSIGSLNAVLAADTDARAVTVGGSTTTDSHAPVSDFPMYYFEDEETWEYVPVYSEITAAYMGGADFIATLNSWVETNLFYNVTDYDENILYSIVYSTWESCSPAPVFAGIHNFADGACSDCGFDPNAPEIIIGDLNGDGIVNATDLKLFRSYLMGCSMSIILEAADLNGSGTVDSTDMSVLIKMIKGAL